MIAKTKFKLKVLVEFLKKYNISLLFILSIYLLLGKAFIASAIDAKTISHSSKIIKLAQEMELSTSLDKKILTSSIPIAGIVQMVTGDLFIIDSINTQNSCPHHYHAVPSDLSKLKEASVVVYVSENFETFFHKLLNHFNAGQENIIKIVDILGNEYTNQNYHIWMDLKLVKKSLLKIKDHLVEKHPLLANKLEKNYQDSLIKISAIEDDRDLLFRSLPKIIILDHSAAALFDSELLEGKVTTFNLSKNPSLQLISNLENLLATDSDICVVTESSSAYSKNNKIDSLYKKYQKPVIEINTDRWPLIEHKGYAENFFLNYQGIITELRKCKTSSGHNSAQNR